MAIADFVLLYNKAAEALAKSDRVGFDFYYVIADAKAQALAKVIPSRKFEPANYLRSARYSESHATFANGYYKIV